MNKKNLICVLFIGLIGCAAMAIVDGIIMPGYVLKSAIKLLFFFAIPLVSALMDREIIFKDVLKFNKKGILTAIAMGIGVYAIILGGYLLLKDVFDFSKVASSLSGNVGVTKSNFIFVAIYISFVNSFLEELFFRGYIFTNLKKNGNRVLAYGVSSILFALYHVALMTGWFSVGLTALLIAALAAAGVIFDYLAEKFDTVCVPWALHMFANFSINTIGFILMSQ